MVYPPGRRRHVRRLRTDEVSERTPAIAVRQDARPEPTSGAGLVLPDRVEREERTIFGLGGVFRGTAGMRFELRDARRPVCQELHQVLGKKQVESPVERHTQLLLEARQLAEVDRPPQPPGDESRELEPEDLRDTRAAADRGQLAEPAEVEGSLAAALERGDDVARRDRTLPQRVLSRGGMRPARAPIRDQGAI